MPAITVRCPGCRKRLSAPERAAGRTLRCPNCGNPVTVVADLDATVVDGTAAPDFSYLRTADDADEDILLADAGDDRESALGQSTARRPAQSTKVVGPPPPPPPPPLVYTPPPVGANGPPAGDNPFAHLADSGPTPPAEPRKKPPAAPIPVAAPAPLVAPRTPAWVWAVVTALAAYAAVATGVAVWGWLRPH